MSKAQRRWSTPDKEPHKPAVGGGGGGGGNWRETIDHHYGPQEPVSVPEPSEPKHTACATCGGIDCKLRVDKKNGIKHSPCRTIRRLDSQKKLKERGFRNLVGGKFADGSLWDMPKASTDGLSAYKKLLRDENPNAPTARPQDGADTRRPDDRGTLDPEISSHSHPNCVDCLALHECT